MCRTVRFCLLVVAIVLLAIPRLSAQSSTFPVLSPGKYIVIGAFNIQRNAERFLAYVRQKEKYDVTGGYQPRKKFYYVYLRTLKPGEDALEVVNRYRKSTEFIDTWVMNVTDLYKGHNTRPTLVIPELTVNKTDQNKAENGANSTPDSSETNNVNRISSDTSSNNAAQPSNQPSAAVSSAPMVPEDTVDRSSGIARLTAKEKVIPTTYIDETGKYKLYFNTYYVRTNKEVKGSVDIIDPKRLKKLKTGFSYELVMVPDPNNGSHEVQLIANIFGYKKVQHDIRLNEPFNDVNQEFFYFVGDTLFVDFPLRRYEKGDIATMYRVFFYKDAAIMKPESKYEVNSLLEMLKENENYRIKIHGHTNGNSPGKIIELADNPKNFFSLNSSGKEGFGSAKELSLQRAEVIKRYLVKYGIDPNRMEVKGWGGKKPLYDKFDRLAVKNVRVEIEILQD